MEQWGVRGQWDPEGLDSSSIVQLVIKRGALEVDGGSLSLSSSPNCKIYIVEISAPS